MKEWTSPKEVGKKEGKLIRKDWKYQENQTQADNHSIRENIEWDEQPSHIQHRDSPKLPHSCSYKKERQPMKAHTPNRLITQGDHPIFVK